MSVRGLKRLTGEFAVEKAQEYTDLALTPLQNSVILNGVLLKNIELANGITEVPHKLGREPIGWLIVGKDATADIWDSQATNARKRITLLLNSSADVVVSLWIF